MRNTSLYYYQKRIFFYSFNFILYFIKFIKRTKELTNYQYFVVDFMNPAPR